MLAVLIEGFAYWAINENLQQETDGLANALEQFVAHGLT